MPRAIWSGAISFGLVNVPVKLYSAVSKKTVRFHQLHEETGQRIQQKRVDSSTGEEVAYEDIVKGYEIGPDRYVVVTPDELDSLDPEKTRTIDILDFVDLEEIDPLYYDHPYYLVPGTGAEKAFALLRTAMEKSAKVAIAKVVIRSKESLVAIRPAGKIMTMSTMLFADEIVDSESLDEGAEKTGKTTKREVEMAEQLIASLTSEFDPSSYKDEYRERVLDLVERKAQGEEISVAPVADEPAPVPDLMAALEASLTQARGDGGKAPAKKPARKRAAGSASKAKPGAAKKPKPKPRAKTKS